MPHVPTIARPETIELVSVPAAHPYVRHVLPADGASPVVRVRPDPDPDDPSRPARGRWWPPVALDAAWVRDQTGEDDFDLFHLHFGYDTAHPEELTDLADALEGTARPLVLTLHDLRNPHHEDPDLLGAQLDVLVPRATALLTLTEGAADEVERRWGRRPLVVPHPHVVTLDTMAAVRATRRERAAAGTAGPPVVGLAVKELRRNVEPLRLLEPLLAALRDREDGARLRVTVQRDVRDRDDERAREVVARLDALATEETGLVDVVWHEHWSDDELTAELAALTVSVLPYRFGTHSGWLEACHDVGTRVLAPSLGHYADQGADAVFTAGEDTLDAASLVAALQRLLDDAAPGADLVGLEADDRRRQQVRIGATTRRVYVEALEAAGGRS